MKLRWLSLLLALPLLLAVYVLYADKFRPVTDGVFRSAQLNPETLRERIAAEGLHSILNLRGHNPREAWYQGERAAAEAAGVRLMDLGISARKLPDFDALRELLHALETLPRPLLVHCQHGNDRSGLAAMLVRLLQGDDLEAAAWEISPWRGVLYPDTVGRQFLAQYQDWLADQGIGHDPEALRRFAREGYLDAGGNFRFTAERIGDQRLAEGGRLRFREDQALVGWAFDPTLGQPPRVAARIGDAPPRPADGGLRRDDVAKALDDPRAAGAGWRLSLQGLGLPGCAPLRLQLTAADGRLWESPVLGELCPET
jgi:protein tyrosine phosphatase (PTP) superfamily phosphohydrolase (DUF442 family)